jgi:hypothetical protein
LSFFRSTSDSRTACRATVRCSGEPSIFHWPAYGRDEGLPSRQKPGADLHAQDARHSLVEARHGDFAGVNLREQVRVKPLPAVWRHVHVDAGQQRLRAAFAAAARQLRM